MRFKKL